jgi:hypothetical protein
MIVRVGVALGRSAAWVARTTVALGVRLAVASSGVSMDASTAGGTGS